MRLATVALAAVAVLASAGTAAAQSPTQRDRDRQERGQDEDADRARPPRFAPLRARPNAGPCPFVKILYDAARYVELDGGRTSASAVGFTGEIEGVTAGCSYQ
ncbi:MAG: Tat pathway signal sequence domain protein, partial [Brevundimonas sp.]|nr:Tat pathway signal sequence domain protein [Brevundimonas sp.]